MMPQVQISTHVFKRLQQHTVPLVDDLDSVLTRVLDFYEAQNEPRGSSGGMPDEPDTKVCSPETPPDLKFTTPRRIVLQGEQFTDKAKIYWNPLLFECVRQAAAIVDKHQLEKLLLINHVTGQALAEKGYRYIEEANMSVQGQDANACWAAIYALVKGANLALEVEFYWQDTPKAAFPGRTGKFIINAY